MARKPERSSTQRATLAEKPVSAAPEAATMAAEPSSIATHAAPLAETASAATSEAKPSLLAPMPFLAQQQAPHIEAATQSPAVETSASEETAAAAEESPGPTVVELLRLQVKAHRRAGESFKTVKLEALALKLEEAKNEIRAVIEDIGRQTDGEFNDSQSELLVGSLVELWKYL